MGFKNIFDEINSKTNLDKNSIFDIADSIKNADLSDEKVLRKLIRDISKMANRNISKEVEDGIIDKIKRDGVPKNISDLF